MIPSEHSGHDASGGEAELFFVVSFLSSLAMSFAARLAGR